MAATLPSLPSNVPEFPRNPQVMARPESPRRLLFEFALAIGAYLLSGRWFIARGNVPVIGHHVPEGFAGVGVAASDDPRVDAYLIDRLDEAGIRHVRLDFTYDDANGPAGRLLEALLARSFKVMLHLVQPYDSARRMTEAAAQQGWRDFVVATLDRFGSRVELVEVCSTVNRKRWAGYTLAGFLAMWEIAHCEVRARGLTLAGPSVTDFEPPFNVGLLALLRRRNLLPDIHTDNLFSERCTEPERFDHKVLGRRLANFVRINLVRKARMLQRIGTDAGVPRLMSPSAFWTLPRIERVLPDSEQKQADYLARYMVLCAASGALERAWWGPLVCHREGLIDDGYPVYPKLERITHYARASGNLADFRARPGLLALKTFSRLIPGGSYEGQQNDAPMLEVHAFRSDERLIHAVWTINGRVAALSDLYEPSDLLAAEYFSRDGDSLGEPPSLASEAPIYICWHASREVRARTHAGVLKAVAIHRHIAGKKYFHFCENGWQGLLLAKDAGEAAILLASIHPERIGTPPRESILRHARNAIWAIVDPRHAGDRLVIKQPVKMHLHKKLLDQFKPSKGLRSWNGTCELMRRGIGVAPPVAYFERCGDTSLMQNYYLCEYVSADFSAREMVSAFAQGEASYRGVAEVDAYRQLCDYLLGMHGRGIFFRDLSGGNVLVSKSEGGVLEFSLIDTGRIHVSNRPLSVGKRLSDLARICNKLHWAGREQFMQMYMAGIGRRFSWWHRFGFFSYDMKVVLKRNFGRKGFKRLFARS